MVSKRKAIRVHCRKRMLQRFNSDVPQDILVNKINNHQGQFLKRQSNRVTIWKVKHEEDVYICVYDKLRKMIVTVLTPEMYTERYERKKKNEPVKKNV